MTTKSKGKRKAMAKVAEQKLVHLAGDLYGRRHGDDSVDICDRTGRMLVFMSDKALDAALNLVPRPWPWSRAGVQHILREERKAIQDEFEALAQRWDKSVKDYADHEAYSIAADCQAHAKSMRSAAEIVRLLLERRDQQPVTVGLREASIAAWNEQHPPDPPDDKKLWRSLTEEEQSALRELDDIQRPTRLREPVDAAEYQHLAVLAHHGLVQTVFRGAALCWQITGRGRALLAAVTLPPKVPGNVCRFPCKPSCTRTAIKGLTMCRKHQPYPAKRRRR